MCFLFGATGLGVTVTGEALIGGVSDDPYLFRTFVRAVCAADGMGHIGTELRYVDSNDAAGDRPPPFEVQPGQPTRAVNNAGLAFTAALAVERAFDESIDSELSDPQTFADLSRRMMAFCQDVDEALELLRVAKAVTPAFSVLLADAQQNLAQVEVGPFGVAVLQRFSREKPGMVVAVNCHQCAELVGFNLPEAQLSYKGNNNGHRWQRGWQLAAKYRGSIDVDVMAVILSDHAHIEEDCSANPVIPWWGHSICNHGTCSNEKYDSGSPCWGTVSAEILQPSSRLLHYAYGWPCGHKPSFADQLYQEASWGCFRAFSVPKQPERQGPQEHVQQRVVPCTTVEGSITEAGRSFM